MKIPFVKFFCCSSSQLIFHNLKEILNLTTSMNQFGLVIYKFNILYFKNSKEFYIVFEFKEDTQMWCFLFKHQLLYFHRKYLYNTILNECEYIKI